MKSFFTPKIGERSGPWTGEEIEPDSGHLRACAVFSLRWTFPTLTRYRYFQPSLQLTTDSPFFVAFLHILKNFSKKVALILS